MFDSATYSSFFRCLTRIVSVMTAAAQSETDAYWMRLAIGAARDAAQLGEVPIGTCIVVGATVLAVAGNRTRIDNDPTAHAELVALRAAAKEATNYRLSDAIVYSTIEPCVMCAGALIQARVQRLVYGAHDERAGAVESHFRVCDTDFLNHRIEVSPGVLEDECREIMQEFFRVRRKDQMSDVRGQISE